MQEFRPASVIAADTALAVRFHEGDQDAVRTLVDRYGAPLTAAVMPNVGAGRADDAVFEVLVRAYREPIASDEDFAPWFADIVEENVGPVDERRWLLAAATSSLDADVRSRLRTHHLDDPTNLADDLVRYELRLRRRLERVGDTDEILAELAKPDSWVVADPDLADRVLAAINPATSSAGSVGEEQVVGESAPVETTGKESRSVVARYMRPALFGLGGGLVVLFVAIIALSAASGTPQPPEYTAELVPTGAIVEVDGGEITVTERDAGIEIELDAETLPRRAADNFYEGRLVLANGVEISAGTFSEAVDVTLWAGAPLDEVVLFEIVARDFGASGDPGDVILKADLPPE